MEDSSTWGIDLLLLEPNLIQRVINGIMRTKRVKGKNKTNEGVRSEITYKNQKMNKKRIKYDFDNVSGKIKGDFGDEQIKDIDTRAGFEGYFPDEKQYWEGRNDERIANGKTPINLVSTVDEYFSSTASKSHALVSRKSNVAFQVPNELLQQRIKELTGNDYDSKTHNAKRRFNGLTEENIGWYFGHINNTEKNREVLRRLSEESSSKIVRENASVWLSYYEDIAAGEDE